MDTQLQLQYNALQVQFGALQLKYDILRRHSFSWIDFYLAARPFFVFASKLAFFNPHVRTAIIATIAGIDMLVKMKKEIEDND